jgi:hypothetical protein
MMAMRFIAFATLCALAGCTDEPESAPTITSGAELHVKVLTRGPNQTLEAHCFSRAPLEELDCVSWIEHELAGGVVETAPFGTCASEDSTVACYRIELDPNTCTTGSGHELSFVHPFTDRTDAVATRAFVECAVR